MDENTQDSGADALTKDLSDLEFQKILDYTIEELLEKAWKEKWKVKNTEFWIKVKNAQNLEYIAKVIGGSA